jgi:SAM-dependent methyltransferase
MPRMPSDATPPDPGLLDFVGSALPAAPARVLEVGAGDGALAAALRERGYDVVAIDPAASTPDVLPVTLLAFDGAPAGFDAAVAVVSLHHVEPLEESCRRLGELVRPGGRLVVDELDVAALDERAARWWLDRRAEAASPPCAITSIRSRSCSRRWPGSSRSTSPCAARTCTAGRSRPACARARRR